MKIYLKSIFKLIKSNFSRFVTLILIVMLGVGFLVGLFSVSPDLELTASNTILEQKMSEVVIRNTSGITENDLTYISNLLDNDNILESRLTFEEDININVNNESKNARVIYQDINNENQDVLKLIEGKKELNEGEILVEQSGSYITAPKLDSVIRINEKDYKVVGVVYNPWYLVKERYNSNVNQTALDLVCYLPLSEKYDYNLDNEVRVYSNLYLYFGYNDPNQFNNNIKNKIKNITNKLNDNEDNIINYHELELKRKIKDEVVLATLDKFGSLVSNFSEENYYKNLEFSVLNNEYNYSKVEEILNNKDNSNLSGNDKNIYDMIKPEIDFAFNSFKEENMINDKLSDFYNLSRYDDSGIILFDMYVDKIKQVSYIFPVFFFIITSLVTLTSLRRLIFEERSQIGTCRALGYSKGKVFSKYLIYGLLGTLIGSMLGILLGIWLIPKVIYDAYITTVHLGSLVYSFNVLNNLLLVLIMLLLITLVIYLTIASTLKESPASLLTPKAPPKGKRIFLEKIPFIWNHLKFKYKSTVRNMIRYKRNLIMMLIGVGGCAALVLVAFGLKDSINTVTDTQFNDIVLYDAIVETKDFSKLNDGNILDKYEVYYDEFKYEDYTIKFISGADELNNYFNFKNKGKEFDLGENDCFISKKVASNFKLKVNDNINYLGKEYKITNIFENYIDNYLIVNDNLTDFNNNKVLIKTKNLSLEEETKFAEKLLENDLITSINFVSTTYSAYQALIDNLNLIVVVVVVFAAILALVVIFNLININVSERQREIATLKVLGYTPYEVHGYIARETFILTFLGIAVGLLLGFGLHQFIASVIDTNTLMAGRNIYWQSYIYTILITLGFSIIVDLCYIPHYKKISMTESLKAIE